MIKIKFLVVSISFVVVLGTSSQSAFSQNTELFIYPKNGQSKEQQELDEFQCHKWSVEQTGLDPMKPETMRVDPSTVAVAQPNTATAGQGAIVGGAAAGAVAGTAVGAIAGDTGEGAAIGATVGALKGARARRQAKRAAAAQADAAAKQQASAVQQAEHANMQKYNKAKMVCLEGRGYTVSM